MQLWNVSNLNLDNKLFIDFLINLGGKYCILTNLTSKVLNFGCKGQPMKDWRGKMYLTQEKKL